MTQNPAAGASDRTIVSTRVLPFTREQIFAAIADPQRLARWWGPAGFRNTFERFDFRPGGEWKYTMHGPDGQDYPNHVRFDAIEAPQRIVLHHVAPHFTLHMALTVQPGGTQLQWLQVFDDARLRDQLAPICVPANEQNFDRLHAELAHHS